jgi:hypothetical protein
VAAHMASRQVLLQQQVEQWWRSHRQG